MEFYHHTDCSYTGTVLIMMPGLSDFHFSHFTVLLFIPVPGNMPILQDESK